MAFVGVNDQLRRDVFVPQRMPELEGLRRRTLAIPIADDDKRGRLDLADKVDGRALGISRWIVIDRRAEEGNHPLVDRVLAIIALPVGDTCPGDRCTEAIRLSNGEH